MPARLLLIFLVAVFGSSANAEVTIGNALRQTSAGVTSALGPGDTEAAVSSQLGAQVAVVDAATQYGAFVSTADASSSSAIDEAELSFVADHAVHCRSSGANTTISCAGSFILDARFTIDTETRVVILGNSLSWDNGLYPAAGTNIVSVSIENSTQQAFYIQNINSPAEWVDGDLLLQPGTYDYRAIFGIQARTRLTQEQMADGSAEIALYFGGPPPNTPPSVPSLGGPTIVALGLALGGAAFRRPMSAT